MSLARMAHKTANHYGPALRDRTGIPLIRQLVDALAISLRCPGTLPSEYYVFGMHDARPRRRAGDIANGYDVETIVSLVQPARHLELGSGFPSEDLDLLNNKDRFRQLCRSNGIPVVEAIVCFADGNVRWNGEQTLPKVDLFVKPLYGGGGYGAARVFYSPTDDRYRVDAPKTSVTERYPDSPMTAIEIVDFFRRVAARIPFVIEPRLVAHARLRELVGSGTLPTLRVVTAIDASGKAGTLALYLRAATTDTPVDNVSGGGIAALIDPDTCRIGVAVTGFGGEVADHPLTRRRLKDAVVPFADAASVIGMAMHGAVAAAQDVPVPVLGWDIAVTDDGPVFVEGNPLSDLTTAQKLLDRGFWADPMFRSAMISHLVALRGTRIPIDPGSVPL
jgi:hypothetical protein